MIDINKETTEDIDQNRLLGEDDMKKKSDSKISKRSPGSKKSKRFSLGNEKYKKLIKSQTVTTEHKKSIHGNAKFKCLLCDYKATTEDSLKRHNKTIHNINESKSFYIGIFEHMRGSQKHKKFKFSLKRRRKSPNGVKYICGQCDYQPSFKNLTKPNQMESIFQSFYSIKEEDLCDWCIGDSRMNHEIKISSFRETKQTEQFVKNSEDDASSVSLVDDLDLEDKNNSLDGEVIAKIGV